MSKMQVKIDGKDFGLWNCCDERTYAKEPISNAEIDKLRKTSEQGKQDVWLRNLTSLKMGEFGIDTKSPKTLLAYWKAQALAAYPSAEENVRYFEEMVRKNERNGSN
ncbi:MAG: hypothetical protein IKB02_05745 [Clostridia bacterium]|nr:hypothetical protein [Clostridia bacterium]